MVIDNIWKQGKISKTVHKYVPVCYLLPTDYKLIFWTSGRWPPFASMHCCKRVCKLLYTRLRRSSSIAATSSTMACLSSWIVTIRLRNTRSFRNLHRKKSGTVRSGDRGGQAMSPKLRTQVTRCCTFQRSIATDHMQWRPLLYRSPSANHDKLSHRRNIQIWNVSVGSVPPCTLHFFMPNSKRHCPYRRLHLEQLVVPYKIWGFHSVAGNESRSPAMWRCVVGRTVRDVRGTVAP